MRPGLRVALEGLSEPGFERDLRERGAVLVDPAAGDLDLVFLYAAATADLGRLHTLRRHLRDSGAIWVLRVKGAGRTLRETDLIEAAREFGLVDNKIASFSDELAAMRLVIPLAMRGSRS